MIDPEGLRLTLDYDPLSGKLRWKHRDDRSAQWNARMAGKHAGTINSNGYVEVRMNGHRYGAHRLAWIITHGVIPAGLTVDHVDRDPSNNRLANLRLATQSQNNANSLRKKSASGVKGVTWRADRNYWMARITINGRSVNLGKFATAPEAHAAYLARARAVFGQFARGAVSEGTKPMGEAEGGCREAKT